MARFGLIEIVNAAVRGLRLRPNAGAANFVELRSPSSLSSNLIITSLATLPGAGTELLTIDNTGQIGRQAAGGGGSVTSVGLALPSLFSVTGSPITGSGTLTGAFASQSANTFLAAPNGVAGVPTMRAIIAADIPKSLDHTWITNFDTQVRSSRLDQMAAPTANVNFNGVRGTGLADPTNAQDAVTKAYADSLISTGTNKGAVRVASTGNINIASPGSSFDGVTLSNAGLDLVLLKDQATAAENGLYVWNGAGAAMTRTTNADTAAEVRTGLFVFVTEGTLNASQGYTLTTGGSINLGTTPLTFIQTSGAGQIDAGSGLTKTGNQINAVGTANRIAIAADNIDISSNYVGQATITTLGTISTGTWNGTAIAVANGGTGATTAANARTNLGVPGVFRQSFTNANLTAGVLTLTHNLGQQIVKVQISDDNNRIVYPDEITFSSTTACVVDLTLFGTLTGTWNAIAVG